MAVNPVPSAEWTPSRRRLILASLAPLQILLTLDVTVVNIALPTIQRSLGFSTSGVTWVVSAYLLTFGSFLILGGRAADLFGRGPVLCAGILTFAAGSLLGGAAQSPGALVAGRLVQGLGGALAAPAALAVVVLLFPEPRERARALALWGGIGLLGGVVGTSLGGLIVQYVSWRAILLINLPILVIPLLVTIAYLEPRPRARKEDSIDVLGALTITAGCASLVYGLLQGGSQGWTEPAALSALAAAVVLIMVFVWVEAVTPRPLVRLSFFAHRRRGTAFAAMFLIGAAATGSFILVALLTQDVLGWSPLRGGASYLGFVVGMGLAFGLGSNLIPRFGVRPVLVGSLLALASGTLTLSRVTPDTSYWSVILPAMLAVGIGLAGSALSLQIAALDGIEEHEAGLAAGTLSAAHEIGAAIGVAALMAVATHQQVAQLASGEAPTDALGSGLSLAFVACAVTLLVAAVPVAVLIGRLVPQGMPPEPVPLDPDGLEQESAPAVTDPEPAAER